MNDDELGPPDWLHAGTSRPGPEVGGPRRKPAPDRRAPGGRERPAVRSSGRRAAASRSRRGTPPPAPANELVPGDDHDGDGDDHDGVDVGDGGGRAGRRAAKRAARSDRHRRRRRTLIVLAIVILPLAAVLGAGGWFLYELNPHGKAGPKITVTIPKGTSNAGIGDLLERKGVIGSARVFQIYTKITGNGGFKPGTYRIHTNLGVRKAVDALEAGPVSPLEFTLALPPGLTLDQIADRVGKVPGHTREQFLAAAQSGQVRSRYEPAGSNSLEGLLSPDTYFIGQKESDVAILRRLVTQFDAKADALGLGNPNAAGLDPYHIVIAASLIEREAGVDEDRPLISAVIRNRLHDRMPLQIDATLCYAKGGCSTKLTNADKLIASPFNTYANPGLPPAPISSVSDKSIKAAQAPANVAYKFYVLADKNGKHAFAATEQEHDKNVEEARRKGLL